MESSNRKCSDEFECTCRLNYVMFSVWSQILCIPKHSRLVHPMYGITHGAGWKISPVGFVLLPDLLLSPIHRFHRGCKADHEYSRALLLSESGISLEFCFEQNSVILSRSSIRSNYTVLIWNEIPQEDRVWILNFSGNVQSLRQPLEQQQGQRRCPLAN